MGGWGVGGTDGRHHLRIYSKGQIAPGVKGMQPNQCIPFCSPTILNNIYRQPFPAFVATAKENEMRDNKSES